MKLKEFYNVSLCKNGVLGGILYVNDMEMIYCTNKLTVPEKYRRLRMEYNKIVGVEKATFHTVRVSMENGEWYRFLVFTREKFLRSIGKKLRK